MDDEISDELNFQLVRSLQVDEFVRNDDGILHKSARPLVIEGFAQNKEQDDMVSSWQQENEEGLSQ